MSIATLTYSLNDSCPITWPQATALMLDYPLIPQIPEPVEDFVHRTYIEALWLPESIVSLSHLVRSLRRVQSPVDGEQPLREMLRPLLLSLRSIETKYQDHLPGLLHDPSAAMEREAEPEENAMWYAWHHGKPSLRHFPDPDNVDEEKWKKRWMVDMERREVLVQILLHLTYLSASPPTLQQDPTPSDRSRKRKRKSLRGSTTRKNGKEPTTQPFLPEENLDLLTDRMAIWQATEEDSEKFLKRPGDNDRDWMRVFFEDEVRPLFAEQLPELIRQFEEKLVPLSSLENAPDSEEDAVPEVETKIKKTRKAHVSKPTLTEADLMDGARRAGNKPKEHIPKALVRSRSISVEPDADGRRSRSRSVSLAAEDLKSVGGKRGGIAGNSKLFASEVDMRRQASGGLKRVSSATSVTFNSTTGSKLVQQRESSVESTTRSAVMGTTLVAETPPRPSNKQPWSVVDSDEDGVPESPEVVYLGSRSTEKSIPETPIKPKQARKR